jgi:hypothetical protein
MKLMSSAGGIEAALLGRRSSNGKKEPLKVGGVRGGGGGGRAKFLGTAKSAPGKELEASRKALE